MGKYLTSTALLVSAIFLTACGSSGSSSESDHSSAVANSSEASPESQKEEGIEEAIVIAGCEVDQYQADMLSKVNAARAAARSCGAEEFAAAEPLTYNCPIEAAAAHHSNDMASNNFFSHLGSDGLRVGARVTATGYDWSVVGENVAAGYDDVDTVVQAWLDSPGHCRNIMDPRFTQFAVKRVDVSSADYDNYWTQVFATAK
ncbi:SCP/PR1 domain-containing protein [Marinobacter lipolyticus SM19]|uniref:SCP/PR1 domain-containing protein n=1 Tax=Marinobacter lipolyticus SM19 TaxID=1318628 RepID=R8AZ50_9GAMM|nr:CAP domain-containing protein [Marinobacter lipolyticus]EON91604.1 SCP/PR1 domain-containing protein [Marinobacter lipolyticus SM19]